jgi:outer membrane protein OmpA-like peptidoglycan-associated protein
LLSGRFLNKTTGALIPNSAHPTLLVNGLTVDSAQIDTANGTFKLALPYGQQYTLEVKATKYISIPSTLNLLGVQSYAIIQQDVYATEDEKHFGLLKGIVINKKTGKPMSSNVPYEIHVNQMQSLAAKINPENGSYSIELPLGALHTVNAKAPGFYPVFEQIDLSKQKTNTVVMKDLVLAPIEVGQSIRLNNIFFEFGKATLKKESFPELNRVVKFLNDNPSIRIEIAGHTDNIGKVEKNKTISQYRAKAVAHYIEKQGIEDKRVDFKGYGATKPVANNKTAVGRALNRRVEFTIISK